MQTYGKWTNPVPTGSPVVRLCWPLFDSDGNLLQKEERNTYVDILSRHGNIFSRIRKYPISQTIWDKGVLYIVEGEQFVRYQQDLWFLRKHGNVHESSVLRTDCTFMMLMREYRFYPYKKDGRSLFTYEYRESGKNAYVWPQYPINEARMQEYRTQCFEECQRLLNNAPWKKYNGFEEAALIQTGTRVWGDIKSPYATKLETEFMWRAYVGTFSDHRFNAAVQTAYVKAAEALPSVASNGIANVLQLASAIASLLRRDYEHASSTIWNAWLAYRYSVCTTLLDISEYETYVQRFIDLASHDSGYVRSHGYYTDGGWTFHVVLKVGIPAIVPQSITEQMEAFGLKLSALNAWDLIPYSFIVDWFLPVGDALELWEQSYKARELPVMEAWCSITSPTGDCFLRAPTTWTSAFPVLGDHKASTKTIFMRIADAIALLQ